MNKLLKKVQEIPDQRLMIYLSVVVGWVLLLLGEVLFPESQSSWKLVLSLPGMVVLFGGLLSLFP